MSALARTFERLDRVEDTTLLWINGAIAAFVLLADGGPLLLDGLGKAAARAEQVPYLYASAAVATIGLLLSVAGLIAPGRRTALLKVQTVLLLALAVVALCLAFAAIATGPVPGINFSWNPLLFAFALAYPLYMARRTLMPTGRSGGTSWQFAPVWAVAASFAISALVV